MKVKELMKILDNESMFTAIVNGKNTGFYGNKEEVNIYFKDYELKEINARDVGIIELEIVKE